MIISAIIYEESVMFRLLQNMVDGLLWGFSLAIGWIAAIVLVGVVAA